MRVAIVTVLTAFLCYVAPAQDAPGKDPARETKGVGIPPRATPADYQAHAQAGTVTVGAEFKGHSVPTPEAVYTNEDYVAVEVGLFGPPEARVKLSHDDFSLRIDGKKNLIPCLPYAAVFRGLKDPEWIPPGGADSKSKSSISTGGGKNDNSLPAVVHMPIELERAMDQRVQKASLLEGERALPEAGLIFFEHRGRTDRIHSIELIYTGPAGKATMALRPE